MPRETPRETPERAAVADAVRTLLDASVHDVTQFDEGLNAVYRVTLDDGAVVLKTATFVTDDELRVEAALLEILDGSTVPTPAVLGVLDPGAGPLSVTAYAMTYRDGRTVPGPLSLSVTERTRLVRESARHLAAVHDADVTDDHGRLTVVDGGLRTETPLSWPALYDDLVAEAVAGLHGEGYTTGDGRFADLAPVAEPALDGDGLERREPEPALLTGDYRPANLVLADAGTEPLIAAVLDAGSGPVGDGLFDLALAEDALVGVPLGGTEEGRRLRQTLRRTYRDHRAVAVDLDGVFDGDDYDRYRLTARVRRLGAFGYWSQFAREDDPDRVAGRWRRFVRERVASLSRSK